MTKLDLKTEYQKQVAQDIPDLWDRIEAGIDAEIEANSSKTLKENRKEKVISFQKIVKYSSLLVAAACMVIVVVAVFKNKSAMETATTRSMNAPKKSDATFDENEAMVETFNEADAAAEENLSKKKSIMADSNYTKEAKTQKDTLNNQEEAETFMEEELEQTADDKAEDVLRSLEIEKEVTVEEIVKSSDKKVFLKVKDIDNEALTIYVPDELSKNLSTNDLHSKVTIVIKDLEEPVKLNGEDVLFELKEIR